MHRLKFSRTASQLIFPISLFTSVENIEISRICCNDFQNLINSSVAPICQIWWKFTYNFSSYPDNKQTDKWIDKRNENSTPIVVEVTKNAPALLTPTLRCLSVCRYVRSLTQAVYPDHTPAGSLSPTALQNNSGYKRWKWIHMHIFRLSLILLYRI